MSMLHFRVEMGIFIPVGSEPLREEGRAEHVFVSGIASEKKAERGDQSSLVKGPRISSILPLSCFALLEEEDGRKEEGGKRWRGKRKIE